MADEIDLANEQTERWLNQMLANRATGPKLVPNGNCYYCGQQFEKNVPDRERKLFCDSDCAEDYEREIRRRNLR